MEGLRHWPDHLESSSILEQANFRARGGDFGKLIADETEKWAKVIKFAGIKSE